MFENEMGDIFWWFYQAAGAAGGALAIMEFIPEKYKHMISGPSLLVDVHTGAIAETILSFGITFAVLLIILKGPRRLLAKTLLLSLATICFVVAGSKYTGPAMNPAIVSIHWFTFLKRWMISLKYVFVCLQCRRLGGRIWPALTTHGTISTCTGSVLSLELYLLHWSSVLSSLHLHLHLHLDHRRNKRNRRNRRKQKNRRKPEVINQSNTTPVQFFTGLGFYKDS